MKPLKRDTLWPAGPVTRDLCSQSLVLTVRYGLRKGTDAHSLRNQRTIP